MDKVAHYKGQIYKMAARSWKANLGNLGQESIQKLKDVGLLNHQKEMIGLRKGSNNIVKNIGGFIDNSENGNLYKSYIKTKFKDDYSKKEIRSLLRRNKRDAAFSMFPFDEDYVGIIRVGNGKVTLGNRISSRIENQPLHNPKRYLKTDFDKAYDFALKERHEADEFREGYKLIKKDNFASKDVFSHISPEVLKRESANVAIAPDKVKRLWIKGRRKESPFLYDLVKRIERFGDNDAEIKEMIYPLKKMMPDISETSYLKNVHNLDYAQSGVYKK